MRRRPLAHRGVRAGLAAALLALPVAAASQQTQARIIAFGYANTYSGADWSVGFAFTPTERVSAFSFGMWLPTAGTFSTLGVGTDRFVDNDPDRALAASYEVGLYDDAMILMGKATIRPDLSTPVPTIMGGEVWYTPLATPLVMDPGREYKLFAAASPGSGMQKEIFTLATAEHGFDGRLSQIVGVQGGDHVSISDGLPIPALIRFSIAGQFSPNMLISDPVAVAPEPGTLALTAGGVIALLAVRRRRRTTGR